MSEEAFLDEDPKWIVLAKGILGCGIGKTFN